MSIFDVANARTEAERLSREANAPGFWDDQERARKTMALLSRYEEEVSRYDRIDAHLADLDEMNRLGIEEDDPAFEA